MSSTCTSPPLTRTLLPLCIQMFDAYVTKWSVVFIITLLSQQQTAASLLSGLPLEAFVDFFLFFFFSYFLDERDSLGLSLERERAFPCPAALPYYIVSRSRRSSWQESSLCWVIQNLRDHQSLQQPRALREPASPRLHPHATQTFVSSMKLVILPWKRDFIFCTTAFISFMISLFSYLVLCYQFVLQ